MPYVQANGLGLYYEESGRGPEAVVMAHGVLLDHRMFDAQRRVLSDRYRVIVYDHRGQGRSEAPRHGYDMDTCSEDAAALIAALGAAPCHFVGLSQGGFVGLRLAARYPKLVRTLSLLSTSAEHEPRERARRYFWLNLGVDLFGPPVAFRAVSTTLFGRTFLADPARAAERERWFAHLAALPRRITRATRGVFARADVTTEMMKILCPTMVLVGDEDVLTPLVCAERVMTGIRNCELVRVPHCGHSSSIEAPDAVTQALARTFVRSPRP